MKAKKDKKIHADTKHAKAHGGKLVEPNPYLETQKSHKDWYSVYEMGKQRRKPKSVPPKVKKQKGTKKHTTKTHKGNR